MWLAYAIGTTTILAGFVLAIFAPSTVTSVLGVVLSGGGGAGLVTAFIKGRSQ